MMVNLGNVLGKLTKDHSIHRIPFRRRRNGRTFVACLYIGPIDYFLRNFASMENLLCEVHDMHINQTNIMGIIVTGFYATMGLASDEEDPPGTRYVATQRLRDANVSEEFIRNRGYPGPMVMSVVRVLSDSRIEDITDEVRERVRKSLEELRRKKAEEQRAKERLAEELKAKEQKAEEKKNKEQKNKEEKGKEQKGKEEKGKEQKGKEQKAEEQKAEEKKTKEQKAKEQKTKEQKGKEQKSKERKAK